MKFSTLMPLSVRLAAAAACHIERVKHDELPLRKFSSSSGLRFNVEFMSIQIVNYGRVMIEI